MYERKTQQNRNILQSAKAYVGTRLALVFCWADERQFSLKVC